MYSLYQLEVLKSQLTSVQEEKEEAALADSTEDYKKAAELKAKECSLTEQIEALNKKIKLKNLTIQDIAEVIENWTKIPVTKITEAETQKLLNLESNLHKRIIGQDEAVAAVARAIRRNRAGLKIDNSDPSVSDIRSYMIMLCNILEALHSMTPPIIHRDLQRVK